ncbi:hypothetical protein [Streptomyces sp. NPDC004230]
MTDFWRRVLAALTHSGPAYNPAAAREADLRDALTDLAERWEKHSSAIDVDLPRELFVEADTGKQWAATVAHSYRTAARDLRDVLRTGLPPHALMTDAELEEHGTREETTR